MELLELLIILFAIIGFFTLLFTAIYIPIYFYLRRKNRTSQEKALESNCDGNWKEEIKNVDFEKILTSKSFGYEDDEFKDASKQVEKEIREAYIFLRKENNSIPSETLEFMKDSAIEKLWSDKNKLPLKELINRIDIEINKTPTSDLRNLLCDVNIILQTIENN